MTNPNSAAQAADPDFVTAELRGIIDVCEGSPTAVVSVERMRLWLSKLRAPGADERQAVAYLDLGTGGYMDVGTDLTDEQLTALPKGRHMLAILGTHDVNGYTPASEAGEPFMYGIMGPDGKAHFEEFCVSGDRDELQAEVVDHLNRDNPEDGSYSVVALFRDAAPQASTVAGEAVTDKMIQAGAKAAREYFERTGGNDPAVIYRAMRAAAPAAPEASAEPARILFPTHLRKMWSGGEVQAWLDQHRGVTPPPATAKGSLARYRQWKAEQDQAAAPCTCPSGDGSLRHPCAEHPPAEACKKEM